MTAIQKAPLPRRQPGSSRAAGSGAQRRAFIFYFSWNNTVDPDWTPDPDAAPTSRKERRVAREMAATERAKAPRHDRA
jgi:hypothetical protein